MRKKTKSQKAEYDIVEHVHRLSSWAASLAASQPGHRFKASAGLAIIEKAKLKEFLRNPHNAVDPTSIDSLHREWRMTVIGIATTEAPQAQFTHGIAAKLINIYFKVGLITIGSQHNKLVNALHPPIDSVLLKALETDDRKSNPPNPARADFWRSKRWTNFESKDYEEVIQKVREKLGLKTPLWMIEEHWSLRASAVERTQRRV